MALPVFSSPRSMPSTPVTSADPSTGARLVTADGRALPLRQTMLQARAQGGVARVVLRQRFENPHAEPLEVTYQLPLPHDGAVTGFQFELDGVVVVGEVDRKQQARERYERALMEGRTAALLEQERPNFFTQKVGNIPPQSAVIAEITVDQKLTWLDEGAWEWRFPTVIGPRYMGSQGRVSDVHNVTVDVSEKSLAHRLMLELSVGDAIVDGYRPESASHPLQALNTPDAFGEEFAAWSYRHAPLRAQSSEVRVGFRDGEGVRLDRDVVVRWPVATPEMGLSLDTAAAPDRAVDAGAVYGLLTLVPPRRDAGVKPVARDLIFLIDTSGSMGGRPLEQAARVVSAMIDTLNDHDRIELIEFSSSPRRWKASPVRATDKNRDEAIQWVRALRAGGSTEMRTALLEALRPLRENAQRQVVLITDGYIGFENEIVATVFRSMPPECRLHTVGVGSSVNRALTGPAAKAGKGVEVVIGLDEDPERAAQTMVARTDGVLMTRMEISGDGVVAQVPARCHDLLAAGPVLIPLQLGAPGSTVRVRGVTARGTWEKTVRVPVAPAQKGVSAVRALYARERVDAHELHLSAGGDQREIDAQIEELGLTFQIATRLTSWVAISQKRTVDTDAVRRQASVPQELPYGVSAEGLGLRAPARSTPFYSIEDEQIDGLFAEETLADERAATATLGYAKLDDGSLRRTGMAHPGHLGAGPAMGGLDDLTRMGLAPSPRPYAAPSYQSAPSGGYTMPDVKPAAPMAPSASYSAPSSPLTYAPAPTMPTRKASGRGWLVALVLFILMALAGYLVWRYVLAAPDSSPHPAPRTQEPRRTGG